MKTIYYFLLLGIVIVPSIVSSQETSDTVKYGIEDLYKFSLDELLIMKVSSATKFEETVSEIPHSIFIITKNDIETYGYRTLQEALQHVPGFYMVDDYSFYKQNFGVRGFFRDEWNQNLVFLVNGVRQRSFDDFNNKFCNMNIPIQSIERIEVIKGAVTATYGPGAFLGVVNIITTSSETKQNFYGNIGNNNTYRGGVNIHSHKDDLYFSVNSGIGTTDGIDQNFSDMGTDSSIMSGDYMKEQYAYFGITAQNQLFTTSLTLDKNINERPLYSPPYINSDYENNASFLALRYSLSLKKEFNKYLSFNTSYLYQFMEEDMNFGIFGLSNSQENQLIKTHSHEFDLNFKISPYKKLSIYLGVNTIYSNDYKNNLDIPLIGFTNTSYTINDPAINFGSYLKLSYNINSKLTLRGGVRLDKSNDFTVTYKYNLGNDIIDPTHQVLDSTYYESYTYPESGYDLLPEFSILFTPSTKHILKLIYAKSMNKLPLFRANDAATGIKPEYIHSFELNYNILVNSKLNVNSSVFYNYYYDLQTINFYIENNTQHQDANNSGKLSALGIESSFDYRPIDQLRFFIAGNYNKTTDLNYKTEYPAFSPQFLGVFNISYSFSHYTIALTNHYVSSTEPKYSYKLSDPNDLNSDPVGREGETAPAYLNTGINIIYKPEFVKGLSVNLRGSNILDQKMYYPVVNVNSWATKGTLGIDRTLLFGINYSF